MDWFLYDNGARHEELNKSGTVPLKKKKFTGSKAKLITQF